MLHSWFETIRILDGVAMHLPWHQARVTATLGATRLDLEDALKEKPWPDHGLYRLRIDYDQTGCILAGELTPYVKRRIQRMAVVDPGRIDYALKWTDRSPLQQARALAPDADEVIIVQDGMITDTSFSNLLFGDGSHWVTPERPLLAGTKRQYLLDRGIITPAAFGVEDIRTYPLCSLITAMLDPGDLVVPTTCISQP